MAARAWMAMEVHGRPRNYPVRIEARIEAAVDPYGARVICCCDKLRVALLGCV